MNAVCLRDKPYSELTDRTVLKVMMICLYTITYLIVPTSHSKKFLIR